MNRQLMEIDMTRAVYATYASYASALNALECAWACGDLFDCDEPAIERSGKRWVITIREQLYAY